MKKFLMGGFLCLLMTLPTNDVLANDADSVESATPSAVVQTDAWELLQKGLAEFAQDHNRQIDIDINGQLGIHQGIVSGNIDSKLLIDSEGNFKGKHRISFSTKEGLMTQEVRYVFDQYGEFDGDDFIIYYGTGTDWVKNKLDLSDGDSTEISDEDFQQQLNEAAGDFQKTIDAQIVGEQDGSMIISLKERAGQESLAADGFVTAVVSADDEEKDGDVLSKQELDELEQLVSLFEPMNLDNVDVKIAVDKQSGAIQRIDIDMLQWAKAQLHRIENDKNTRASMMLPDGKYDMMKLKITLQMSEPTRAIFVKVPYYVKSTAKEDNMQLWKSSEFLPLTI